MITNEKTIETQVKDLLELEGWRREGNYIGHGISERWESRYNYLKNRIEEIGFDKTVHEVIEP